MYQSAGINKPAQKYNPDLDVGCPLWEEEVNDLTGRAIGWLTLYRTDDGQYVVHYDDRVRMAALDRKARATDAKLKPEPKWLDFEAETSPEDDNFRDVKSRLVPEWLYDITENKLGEFIIAGWKALNPHRVAAWAEGTSELGAKEGTASVEGTVIR